MSENDDVVDGPEDSACSECHRRFLISTGEILKGWEKVYIVTPGPLLCRKCKEAVIVALEKGVPV